MFERIKNTTCFIRSRLRIAPKRYFLGCDQRPDDGADNAYVDRPADEPSERYPAPEVGIILGSGLGCLAEAIEPVGEAFLPYSEIPGFPQSTVPGHEGRFIYGKLGGKYVIAMQGRVHFYEGYPIGEVVLPVRAMCCLGIKTLVVSNAAGGICPLFEVGDIMVIEDQINLIPNPLVGPNIDELGTRFPDMSQAYDKSLIALAHAEALVQGLQLRQGCYVGSSGPTFETPAEYRYFRTLGADATGMSTTPEVIVARHQGVKVLGFSLISNMGISNKLDYTPPRLTPQGLPEEDDAAEAAFGVGSHQEVMEAGAAAGPVLSRLVTAIIEKI